MSGTEPNFGEMLEMFESDLVSSTELTLAARTDRERAMAASVIAHRHLQRPGGFPSAANCLTNALTQITDPVQTAKLRIEQALAYKHHGHTGFAVLMVDRGLNALGLPVDGASNNVHHELQVLREVLTCTA